ncbi:hypothetical protein AB4Z38_23025 [Arthrobacter sp. 2RAF6]|uniref:hypothetical protein n=1 Tax=Arthrobacter sp. 2RAF6 TaxID=3233002 RepID=UPI003F8E1C1D
MWPKEAIPQDPAASPVGRTLYSSNEDTTGKGAPSLARAPRAYVIGMLIASAGLWLAVLAPALVVLAIKVFELTTPIPGQAPSLVAGSRPDCAAAQALRQSQVPAMAPPVITLGGNPRSS